jgi:uncharacterized membrane protein (DUF106 family)
MLFRIITWLFVIGIVVRLINRYIAPIFRITTVANDRMRQMQDQMNEMNSRVNQNTNSPRPKVEKEGDYIDYEEVK